MIAILDCYTDEPAGLGVPPYLGVYPRYLYGYLKSLGESDIAYLTIDDLRLWVNYDGRILAPSIKQRTNISTNNLSLNQASVHDVLRRADALYIILGVHTPGKYLSATPGTLKEVSRLLQNYMVRKILTGPVLFGGSQMFGGRMVEKSAISADYDTLDIGFSYKAIARYALAGTEIIKQVQDVRIIEIETLRGCQRNPGCSFCLEPLKNRLEFREMQDILSEMKAFYKLGVRHFRLGKQSCFYSYPYAVELLSEIRRELPGLRVLHIDNVNPVNVVQDYERNSSRITNAIVKHCTPGNVAAFGVESFDAEVVRMNNLNSSPEISLKAIEILNKLGSERGENGVPKFLPGINLIFGLMGETAKAHGENMKCLRSILEKYMLRRINIREVIPYEGTEIKAKAGISVIKRNRKHYWKWRNEIRQEIDLPMLKKVFPPGAILKDMHAEIYDGNTTFLRQIGTYPIIVGVKGRIELKKFYSIRVKSHMLRSLVCEIV